MSRPVIVTNAASTSTGSWPTSTQVDGRAYFSFGQAVQNVSVQFSHPSTKQVSWTVQGRIGGSSFWTDLMAATSSTGTGLVSSTVVAVVTQGRINVTANGSTGNVTSKWYVVGA